MRSDTWIQIPRAADVVAGSGFCRALQTEDESPSEADTRTVLAYMGEWLPMEEVSGRRLFRAELEELCLLESAEADERLRLIFSNGFNLRSPS